MFLHQKNGESWNKKRKACYHAFCDVRIEKMMDVLKEKLNNYIDKVYAEIDASPDGQTTVDIACDYEKIFCRNIVHICFGEDVSDMKFEIDVRKEKPSYEFERKTLNLPEAINEFNASVFEEMGFKWLNELY